MLFQRSDMADRTRTQNANLTNKQQEQAAKGTDGDRPLTCMFFFFASQMRQNLQAADPDLVHRRRMPDRPTHKLDSMIARIGMHASHSPLIAKFDTYPVEIPQSMGWSAKNPPPSRDEAHDTIMMIKFRDKRAREEWIATREWQEFMRSTESDQVFRRMPHVRCASSMRGLMDPFDSLTA